MHDAGFESSDAGYYILWILRFSISLRAICLKKINRLTMILLEISTNRRRSLSDFVLVVVF